MTPTRINPQTPPPHTHTHTHLEKYIACIEQYRHLMHLTSVEYIHTQCVNRNTHMHPDHTVYIHMSSLPRVNPKCRLGYVVIQIHTYKQASGAG